MIQMKPSWLIWCNSSAFAWREWVRKITKKNLHHTSITTAFCGSTPKTGTSGMLTIRVFFHNRFLAILRTTDCGWLCRAASWEERSMLPFAWAALSCAALSSKLLRARGRERGAANGSANRGKAALGCHKWIAMRLAKCWWRVVRYV